MLYTPKAFKVDQKEQIFDFIEQHSFASILSVKNSFIHKISKIPLLLSSEGNGEHYLSGHFSMANDHWKYLNESPQVVTMFDGNHNYISPMWMANPLKNVPTWNYSTVIVQGEAEVIDDEQWILQHLSDLTSKFENTNEWFKTVDKKHFNMLTKKIVGIRIKIIEIEAKFKMSQNKSEEDQHRISKKIGLKLFN